MTRIRIGVAVRSMGPQSRPDTLLRCVQAAERLGLDDAWVQDHIAIPPDDAEGSGGRYLDPLTALAWLAGATSRIGLGTGVLNLPYRPPLPTAKALATVQEVSAGRLRVGVGVGWMEPEFRALGVDRRRRGALADETLAFLRRCFESDEVEANGQPFLFLPRPPRPPLYIGGAAPHALDRATRFGDGWMPMGGTPESLRDPVAELRERFAAAGRPPPEVLVMTGFAPADPAAAVDRARGLVEAGATQLIVGSRYADAAEFERGAAFVAEHVRPAV